MIISNPRFDLGFGLGAPLVVTLAERLSLERLYVHGNDADLILRRDGSPGAMRDEVTADLFA